LISVCWRGGELDLGLLGRLLQALQGQRVLAKVDALVLAELVGQVVDQAHVEVLAAEEGVAVGRLHLEHAVADLQDGDVERCRRRGRRRRSSCPRSSPVHRRGRRGRLVDDAQHVQAGDLAGVLGGLALGVVEIGRDGDDRLLDLLAEIGLGRLLHLLQGEGGNLRGGIFLPVDVDPGIAIVAGDDLVGDELLVSLDRLVVEAAPIRRFTAKDRAGRVGHGLTLGRLADKALAVGGEGDDGGSGATALGVLDHLRRLAVHDGDAGIRRAKINTNDFRHASLLLRQAGRTRNGIRALKAFALAGPQI
jgi:hypothetical protein